MNTRRKKEAGFTLIELMIVLAIIAITATLVISNLSGSRKAGNETSAIKGIRASLEAAAVYKKLGVSGDTDGDGNGQEYPANLAGLVDTGGQNLVPMVATNPYHGYFYAGAISGADPEEAFFIECGPNTFQIDGDRGFAGCTADGQCWGAAAAAAGAPGVVPWALPSAVGPGGAYLAVQE